VLIIVMMVSSSSTRLRRAEAVMPRIAWQLAIASLFLIYLLPDVIVFLLLDDPTVAPLHMMPPRSSVWRWGSEAFARDPWTPADWPMWVLPLLAIALPTWLHHHLAKRNREAYRIERSRGHGGGYRNASPLTVTLCPESARRRRGLYALRLGLAMGLVCVPIARLLSARVTVSWGCVFYPELAVPAYFIDATLILIALVFHVPTNRRLIGRPPELSQKS
jgi:hypothetical protein